MFFLRKEGEIMYMAKTFELAWDDNPPATWMDQNNIDICIC